ncbi:di-heme oxidoredictase family protein [Notoacmeibacter sp. MSK16QG-6]|uniref:di-heme oxidoreductase family protein n=1 Tax=Notoacmeibacter sp. MSK16QG-6 TaxID=2957982 RepID=UPI0020A17C09|nr:di-heme oxidoredictase family protein [Notoacmeibacter sp. MSK16QG-6]MCP1198568.1 c-type cytochrome [Notoacmeibacter sp. MSK16QG-6]
MMKCGASRTSGPIVALLCISMLGAVGSAQAADDAVPVADGGQFPPYANVTGSLIERNDLSEKDRRRVVSVTTPAKSFDKPEPFEAMSGGAATSAKIVNRDAFSHFSANLTFAEEERFKLGNALFRKLWVASPSSTSASDGLGPLFNARACQNCHLKDGRGQPPVPGEPAVSMLIRLGKPAVTDDERAALENFLAPAIPDDTYGGQLQTAAVPGLLPEGQVDIRYEEMPVTLGDGTIVSLRKPHYSVRDLAYGPLDEHISLSPRIANPMIGMGLIQAIHPADLAANADPDDADGDGISGRMAWARGSLTDHVVPGRFGWKAQNATVHEQSSEALAGDIGISSPPVPRSYGDCTDAQADCLAQPNGEQKRLGPTEAPDPVIELITFYSENLAVPERRDVADKAVLAGKEAFYGAGCASCHTPKFVTRRDASNEAHAFQLIWPYSDFLLHDMGEGLADGQQVGRANGQEWRTQPLWGIGLTEIVSGHTLFLHDGRARNLEEAILWHGGEAQTARDAYAAMEKSEREALIAFLESL